MRDMRDGEPGTSSWGRWFSACILGSALLLVVVVLVMPRGASSLESKRGSSGGWSLGGDPTPTPTPPIRATYLTRRGAEFHVKPEEARVTVNGRYIGKADDWDDAGGGDTYFFKGQGWYYVKFSLKGYETMWVKVVVDPNAKDKIVKVKDKLHRY